MEANEPLPEAAVSVQTNANEPQPPPLDEMLQSHSFPSVLLFLQREWQRFERERSEWELEKDALKGRLAVLEGERRGFDVMKTDLLRRIRMLEAALKQERSKNNPDQEQQSAPDETSTPEQAPETAPSDRSKIPLSKVPLSRSKNILKQFLHEIGMEEEMVAQTDNIAYLQSLTGGLSAVPFLFGTRQDKAVEPSLSRSSSPEEKILLPPQPTAMQEAPASQPKQHPLQVMHRNSKQSRRTKVSESIIYNPGELDEITYDEQSKKGRGMLESLAKELEQQKGLTESARKNNIETNNLGAELADLSLSEESGDGSRSGSSEPKIWKPKLTLRSHFDTVRACAFHPNNLSCLTTSDDGSIKYWNLEKPLSVKKVPADIEPVYNFRGHDGPVFSIAVGTMIPPSAEAELEQRLEYGVAYTGGYDGQIRIWGLPDRNVSPYAPFIYKQFSIGTFSGHKNSVWDLRLHPIRPLLASSSSDGTVRLWDLNTLKNGTGDDHLGYMDDLSSASTSILQFDGQTDSPLSNDDTIPIPTSVDFVRDDLTKLIISFNNSALRIYDIETGKPVVDFSDAALTYDGTISTQINHVITHQHQPIAVTAHEDRHIRMFDTRSGNTTHTMIAHLDAVTNLDISPDGRVLVSCGHDSSVRLWDLQQRHCLQELSAHRKKFDEGIMCVKFHPRRIESSVAVSGSSGFLLTGGADSCARVFACS